MSTCVQSLEFRYFVIEKLFQQSFFYRSITSFGVCSDSVRSWSSLIPINLESNVIIVYVYYFISGVALIYGITTRITLLSIVAFIRTWFIYLFQYDVRESRRLIVLQWRVISFLIRSASPRHWISDPFPRVYLECIFHVF